MANRRISDLPAITAIDINDADLFTLVHVAEADPGLKNKKLTISDHRQYLNAYYVTITGGTTGPLQVTGDLTVYGNTNIRSGLVVSGTGTFGGISVNTFIATGTFSGNVITGQAIQGVNVNATTGYIVNCRIINGTGDSFEATNFSGGTITGNIIRASGITGQVITGDTINAITISGTTVTGGASRFNSYFINGTTFVSGAGDVRPFNTFSFPSAQGTSGYVLTTLGNGQTVWALSSTTGIVVSNIINETKISIDTNYAIGVGYNGISAGPVDIQSGITVTIPSGSSWRILD